MTEHDHVNKATNGHHCPVCIYAKMISITEAMKRYEETFFVDTDVVFLEKFEVPDAEIVRSPNFFTKEKYEDAW